MQSSSPARFKRNPGRSSRATRATTSYLKQQLETLTILRDETRLQLPSILYSLFFSDPVTSSFNKLEVEIKKINDELKKGEESKVKKNTLNKKTLNKEYGAHSFLCQVTTTRQHYRKNNEVKFAAIRSEEIEDECKTMTDICIAKGHNK